MQVPALAFTSVPGGGSKTAATGALSQGVGGLAQSRLTSFLGSLRPDSLISPAPRRSLKTSSLTSPVPSSEVALSAAKTALCQKRPRERAVSPLAASPASSPRTGVSYAESHVRPPKLHLASESALGNCCQGRNGASSSQAIGKGKGGARAEQRRRRIVPASESPDDDGATAEVISDWLSGKTSGSGVKSMRGISISSTPSEPRAAPAAVATRLATPTAAAVASVPAIILLDDSDDDSPAAMRATAAAGECAPARAEGGLHQHNNPRDAQGKGAVSGATPGALGTEAAPEAEEWSSDSEALGEFSRPAPRPAPAGGYAPALAPSAGGAAGVCASYRAAQPPARGHRDLWAASHGGGVGAALEGGMKLQYSTGSGRGNGREGGGGQRVSPGTRRFPGAGPCHQAASARGPNRLRVPPQAPRAVIRVGPCGASAPLARRPGSLRRRCRGGGLVTASTRAAAAPECREVTLHESAGREAARERPSAQRRASPGGRDGEGG